jgi:transcriptional regulator with XRE-family HTH domain
MTGDQLRKKIKSRKRSYKSVAEAIGETPQNFQNMLNASDVKSGTLERIAKALGEPVSFFFEELPIVSLEDYADYIALKKENEMLQSLVREKEEELRQLLLALRDLKK